MLKILHIIPNLLKGGAQRIVIDICNELSIRKSCEVLLIYFDGSNEFEYLTSDINLKKINIQFDLSFSSSSKINISEYEHILDTFKPNIVHSHLYPAELISRENQREEISYFTHCHDNIRQLQKFKFDFLYNKIQLVEYFERIRLLKRYKKCNNTFIAISKDGFNFLETNLPLSFKNNIDFIPNAINTNNFIIDENSEKPFSKLTLINIGNFIPKKNQVFLLDVLKELINKHKNCHLTLVGDGITRNIVEERIEELKLQPYITLAGKIDNIKELLSQNLIYVHSAIYEPFGLVLVEAMAAGLPIISLNGKGNQDVIIDGYNGYIINDRDPYLFANKILEIYSNPNEYNTIAKNAQKDAIERFDIKPYTDKLLKLYLSSLKK